MSLNPGGASVPIIIVANSGNQPYTISGLAITRTLSETSPSVFYSLEHYLFGLWPVVQQLFCSLA